MWECQYGLGVRLEASGLDAVEASRLLPLSRVEAYGEGLVCVVRAMAKRRSVNRRNATPSLATILFQYRQDGPVPQTHALAGSGRDRVQKASLGMY